MEFKSPEAKSFEPKPNNSLKDSFEKRMPGNQCWKCQYKMIFTTMVIKFGYISDQIPNPVNAIMIAVMPLANADTMFIMFFCLNFKSAVSFTPWIDMNEFKNIITAFTQTICANMGCL